MMLSRVTTLILLCLTVPALFGADAKVPLPADLSGTIHGADYLIRVPGNWNGKLIVYAHAYGENLYLPQETPLLAQGYALAASAFREGGQGWAVQEGIEDTWILTHYFSLHVGKPDRTILWGASLGGLITVASIERHPFTYDAGISVCGVVGGSPKWWDQTLAFAVAYDVAFGWLPEWGSLGDVRDDLDFWTDISGLAGAQLMDPANYGKWEFIRRVSGMSPQGFYDMSQWGFPWMFLRMWQATGMRAEGESRAGGPVAQNSDHEYDLSDSDKAELAALGVDAEDLLAEMNLRRNYVADPGARAYMQLWAEPTGWTHRPILTVHTADDPGTPTAHVRHYRNVVASRGRQDFLVESYVDAVGHCTFTDQQLLHTIGVMEEWLDTGMSPTENAFPTSMGFVHGFEPPPWPFEPEHHDTGNGQEPPANEAPVAVVGPHGVTTALKQIQLDGSQSYDPEGEALTFSWSVTRGSVALMHGDTPRPMVQFAGGAGQYTFELTVTDPEGANDTAAVTVIYVGR